MKSQFNHHVVNSFCLWSDHFLLSRAEAYKNISAPLFPQGKDKQLTSLYSYASPFKQWVADSSVTGATIPSGVYIDSVFTPLTGISGHFDYENGRLLSPLLITGAISGNFSIKDINQYLPNENEEDLIFENRYHTNSRFKISQTGIEPYEPVLPALFLSIESGENEEFAFGGEEETEINVKSVVITDDLYTMEGTLSCYKDSARSVFNMIPFEVNPFNEYGDLKSGSYNYNDLAAQHTDGVFFIERVVTSKLSETLKNDAVRNVFVGFVDFTIKIIRYPRV